MSITKNASKIVGHFIKTKRETLGMSQKDLGLRLQPNVTTQFISNVERGITPLPATHISSVAEVLQIPEKELLLLLEKEFSIKMSHKISIKEQNLQTSNPEINQNTDWSNASILIIKNKDYPIFKELYSKFELMNEIEKESFIKKTQNLVHETD